MLVNGVGVGVGVGVAVNVGFWLSVFVGFRRCEIGKVRGRWWVWVSMRWVIQ